MLSSILVVIAAMASRATGEEVCSVGHQECQKPDQTALLQSRVSLAQESDADTPTVHQRDVEVDTATTKILAGLEKLDVEKKVDGIGYKVNKMRKTSAQSCALPEGARWCQVQLGLKYGDITMAVYSNDDIVSNSICNTGTWEISHDDLKEFGQAGHALDIGANLGFYSLVLAAVGWNVTAFEPMPKNNALIHASLCRNPQFKSQVTLHEFGLGAKNDHCVIQSGFDNVGDGILACGKDAKQRPQMGYKVRAELDIRRLDDVLAEQKVSHIDFMKMDVEGFECQVIAGAPSLLGTIRPRLIQSEVWPKMQGCSPKEYFKSYTNAKYQVAKDKQCQFPDQSSPVDISNRFMCALNKGATSSGATGHAVSLLQQSSLQWQQRSIVWFRAE